VPQTEGDYTFGQDYTFGDDDEVIDTKHELGHILTFIQHIGNNPALVVLAVWTTLVMIIFVWMFIAAHRAQQLHNPFPGLYNHALRVLREMWQDLCAVGRGVHDLWPDSLLGDIAVSTLVCTVIFLFAYSCCYECDWFWAVVPC